MPYDVAEPVSKRELIKILRELSVFPIKFRSQDEAKELADRIEQAGIEFDAADAANLPGIPDTVAIHIEAERSGNTVVLNAAIDTDFLERSHSIKVILDWLDPVWCGADGSSMVLSLPYEK